MKLSPQAIGALLITLQKCLAEQVDISELLSDWELNVENDLLYVINAPTVTAPQEVTDTKNKFEVE